MPQVAKLAGVTSDARAPASRAVRRQGAVGASGARAGVTASRPTVYAGPAVAQLTDIGTRSQMSPRVFAGLVRMAEFALVSGVGFLIAYFYVADFFRQYAAALSLAGFAAVTVFQSLGLYNMAALSAAHRQMPRLLLGWTATVGLLLAGRVLPQGCAGLLPRLACPVVRERRGRSRGLPRHRLGADAARPGPGPADAACHRVRHRPSLREPAAGARRRSAQRHPHLRGIRRPRRRAGEPHRSPAMPISATCRR